MASCHAELVSASIPENDERMGKWTLERKSPQVKRVQGDEEGRARNMLSYSPTNVLFGGMKVAHPISVAAFRRTARVSANFGNIRAQAVRGTAEYECRAQDWRGQFKHECRGRFA
jgi:hypothetical protein